MVYWISREQARDSWERGDTIAEGRNDGWGEIRYLGTYSLWGMRVGGSRIIIGDGDDKIANKGGGAPNVRQQPEGRRRPYDCFFFL